MRNDAGCRHAWWRFGWRFGWRFAQWFGLLLVLLCGPAGWAQAADASSWTSSADPYAPAGHCRSQSSAMGPKWVIVNAVGETTANVLALQVLSCKPFSGVCCSKVDCEAAGAGGVPYAYCARAGNDGLGNDITIGALERDAVTDANGLYTGCPAGAGLRPKLEVVLAAKVDPRRLSGIVTLSCTPATGERAAPTAVPCPPEPHPYAGCVGTTNDGHGNAVTLALVRANGPSDPYGLYGECDSSPPVRAGFLYKADALAQAGQPFDNVRGVDVAYCSLGFGAQAFTAMPCADIGGFSPLQLAIYDYCVVGTDVHNNHLILGVSSKQQPAQRQP